MYEILNGTLPHFDLEVLVIISGNSVSVAYRECKDYNLSFNIVNQILVIKKHDMHPVLKDYCLKKIL